MADLVILEAESNTLDSCSPLLFAARRRLVHYSQSLMEQRGAGACLGIPKGNASVQPAIIARFAE